MKTLSPGQKAAVTRAANRRAADYAARGQKAAQTRKANARAAAEQLAHAKRVRAGIRAGITRGLRTELAS